ncbi:MAG: DUF22 domain-containing protein [Candidatus Nezhaarchaeales archaeon]|nr:MAG: hypothetical protein DSO06_01255 [Candidatus Nezhaarchaeota archaeon WYZ-LMO8]TDA37025.1 MAG: hypothetical protein DSO05_01575 [Candidatus Nezhaarchaeota archaeon WYZ-LMO7]
MSYINLVYIDKKGYEVKRLRIQEETYEYLISTRARWEPVIAIEGVTLRANNVYQISIRPIRLSPNELVVPCPVEWNGLGQLVSVGRRGIPRKVERERLFDHANFLAFRDGNILEGDLLGVLNVFPQATILPILRSTTREVPPPYRS